MRRGTDTRLHRARQIPRSLRDARSAASAARLAIWRFYRDLLSPILTTGTPRGEGHPIRLELRSLDRRGVWHLEGSHKPPEARGGDGVPSAATVEQRTAPGELQRKVAGI